MKRIVIVLVVAASVASVLAFALPGGKASVRPFIALAHPGQVVQPHQSPDSNLTAFFLYDSATRMLTFTLSEGDPELVWGIRGPAGPGEVGPDVAFGPWSSGPIEVGPIDRSEARALRSGQLYLLLLQPSALPEPPRAMRGQILPIPGVRYRSGG